MSECKRAVLSCQRCRKRKIKCDRVMPSCSQCIASKTSCTGFDGTNDSKGIPRSIVRHLEYEIAKLETALGTSDVDVVRGADILLQIYHPVASPIDTVTDSSRLKTSPNQTLVDGSHDDQATLEEEHLLNTIKASRGLQSMVLASLPREYGMTSKIRTGLTPSSTKSAPNITSDATDIQRSSVSPKPAVLNSQLEARLLTSLPIEIIQALVKKYVKTIVPQFPFMLGSEVNAHLDKVLAALHAFQAASPLSSTGERKALSVEPNADFLVIYLVLAISITIGSAKGGHEVRCMSFSTSLFEEGIQHFTGQAESSSDLAALQINLLILLYATINPRAGNVWILSGIAMRTCSELGLHRNGDYTGIESSKIDLRRRIFWSAYCLDRSICAALQRPLSLPGTTIDVKLPSPHAELPGRIPFMGTIDYHRMQSEIMLTHFTNQPMACGSFEEFQAIMEKRLREWYETSQSETPILELCDFHLARGLAILHRPSPRNVMPSQRSLLIAFEAACSAARCQSDHLQNGVFRRHWLSAHFTLEMAILSCFCLRYACRAICEKFDPGQVFEMTKLATSNFLHISSRGWPEVSKYAGIYERLLGPLLQAVFSPDKNPEHFFLPSHDAELKALLYPRPLELEKHCHGSTRTEDVSEFDFNILDFNELNFDVEGVQSDFSTSFLTGFELLDHALAADDCAIEVSEIAS
ncbi:uncharacterized protein PV09_08201 [Verruconis gallopava]|uniref:Zn(2)-C6 fungal-type domain-containing protein n=1 Tax=Verruconis gallopava TaxID=253628 RepID=A0A0D2AMF4_9PEZI|nr:uncharacterized protein PV09_08201 [Verruconis gallopava]KIW00314.1 hypothetical protein PV09_08201 [Verruconis gallopava]